jgi:hypothetical protein
MFYVWIELGTGEFHKNIISDCDRRDNRRSASHTSHELHLYNFQSLRIKTR